MTDLLSRWELERRQVVEDIKRHQEDADRIERGLQVMLEQMDRRTELLKLIEATLTKLRQEAETNG